MLSQQTPALRVTYESWQTKYTAEKLAKCRAYNSSLTKCGNHENQAGKKKASARYHRKINQQPEGLPNNQNVEAVPQRNLG